MGAELIETTTQGKDKSEISHEVSGTTDNTTTCGDAVLVNIYAPFGSNSRLEGDIFVKNEVIFFLRRTLQHCILGGYFNCVVHPLDCTNTFRPGRTLEQLITQYGLVDTCANTPTHLIFTHYK
jgi:hypothetical protein